MSRVLLDENIPIGLRNLLGNHDVVTVDYMGWKGLTNGRLLDAAEARHFDILISADQNLRFQQTLGGRAIAVVMLSTTRWRAVRASSDTVRSTVDQARSGNLYSLNIEAPPTGGDRS